MSTARHPQHACSVCGKMFTHRDLLQGLAVSEAVAREIREDLPAWSHEGYICREDLARYRSQHVQHLLKKEKGELSALDREVVESLRNHELLSSNVDDEVSSDITFGERLADRIATFGGSWSFLICFALFLFVWVALNSIALLQPPVDPYPYILLNLLLSCLASIQAPLILMSQNRQESRDRLRAQNDYQVNLKAELEIRHLHEKVDHLLSHQWERLVEIQEVQIELLSELSRRK
jgi:uncharacterized membrane protein